MNEIIFSSTTVLLMIMMNVLLLLWLQSSSDPHLHPFPADFGDPRCWSFFLFLLTSHHHHHHHQKTQRKTNRITRVVVTVHNNHHPQITASESCIPSSLGYFSLPLFRMMIMVSRTTKLPADESCLSLTTQLSVKKESTVNNHHEMSWIVQNDHHDEDDGRSQSEGRMKGGIGW